MEEEFNDTHNDYSDEPEKLIYHPLFQAPFYVLYSLIFFIGVFGNVLICYVVGRNKAMQTVTNFFIANLALSDILLCVLGVPFTPIYSFTGEWVFGRMLCHLVSYSQGTSVYVSTMTLTSIAIDRYFVILYPFKPRMKLTTCLSIISCIWIFALCATLPYVIFMEFTLENGKNYCSESWMSEGERKIFGAVTTSLQFIVPFVVITFAYAKVCIRLKARAKAKPGVKSTRGEEIDRERKKRTNRMLIAMVAIFALSWLPLNLLNLSNDVTEDAGLWAYYEPLFFVAHCIAMSSTCYNVFVYAWLNDNFRKEFKQVLPCYRAKTPETARRRSLRKPAEENNGLLNDHQLNNDMKGASLRTVSTLVLPAEDGSPERSELRKGSDLVAEFCVDTETILLKTAVDGRKDIDQHNETV